MSELYQLGRRLSQLALDGMGARGPGLTPSEFLVLQDLFLNGQSSIREIVERTGVAQSRVSTSVARFADRGWVTTAPDPTDGRKTLVRVTDTVKTEGERRRAGTGRDALSSALAGVKGSERAQLLNALHRLRQLLSPTTTDTLEAAHPRVRFPATEAAQVRRGRAPDFSPARRLWPLS